MKNLGIIVAVFVAYLAFTFFGKPSASDNVSIIEVDAKIMQQAQAGEILLLDVRSPMEYAEGHIPGAINVPYDQIQRHQDVLAQQGERPIVVYCRSGRRAGIFINEVEKYGVTNLQYMQGDMPGWQRAGLPVATGN